MRSRTSVGLRCRWPSMSIVDQKYTEFCFYKVGMPSGGIEKGVDDHVLKDQCICNAWPQAPKHGWRPCKDNLAMRAASSARDFQDSLWRIEKRSKINDLGLLVARVRISVNNWSRCSLQMPKKVYLIHFLKFFCFGITWRATMYQKTHVFAMPCQRLIFTTQRPWL